MQIRIWLYLAMALFSLPVLAEPKIEIYTTSYLPVHLNDYTVTYHMVDQAEPSLDFFNQNLPSDPQLAKEEVFRRMATDQGKEALESIKKFNLAKFGAWAIGVDRLPAIVFDDQYVVYGIYRVDQAVSHYTDYIGRQP